MDRYGSSGTAAALAAMGFTEPMPTPVAPAPPPVFQGPQAPPEFTSFPTVGFRQESGGYSPVGFRSESPGFSATGFRPEGPGIGITGFRPEGSPFTGLGLVPEGPNGALLNPVTGIVDPAYQQKLDQATAQFAGMGTGIGAGIGGATPGAGGPIGSFAPLDSYNPYFSSAAQSVGMDPNLLKAIAMVEHGWDQPVSPAGAVGIMQLMPNWESELGVNRYDPAQNILGGAKVLQIKKSEGDGTWDDAIRRYHGYGSDGYTTDMQYLQLVKQAYQQLTGQAFTGQVGSSGWGGGNIATIWGGGPPNISQEFGMTGFAQGNPLYDYSAVYSPNGQPIGHTGLDVSMNVGTPLYAPVAGTVVCAGTGYGTGDPTSGCTAFGSDVCNGPCGRFEIALDNGDYLILGHTSNVVVRAGQRVNAGSLVAYSGTQNGGHVHVEYRTPGPTKSGYQIVDPRTKLNGSALTGGASSSFPSGPTTSGYGGDFTSFFLSHLYG